ncbi:hypothetical protein HYU21_04650 [Candidatus Woesearchaeota archaeon]|nr:hypothetical protein [Candidatus Woesearchaeota archaeon]
MFKVPLPELREIILQSKKITPRDLDQRLKEKINELSGLISEEGAAHIIANELGVELTKKGSEKLKVKEIYAGMRDVTVLGRVVKKFDVREFSKEEKKGKLCAVIIGDETGTIRIVFWNEQVNLLEKVSENDILLIKHAYAKENNNAKELHFGERGEVQINPEGQEIITVKTTSAAERKKISELLEGQSAELLAVVVQAFDPRFFTVCPRCNRKATPNGETYNCSEHGEVTPSQSYVLNLILDDGSSTIRSVFWKNQVNHLLGKEEITMLPYRDNPGSFEEVKTELLGEQLKITGNVRKNEMFERLEFNVLTVEKANPENEIAKLESA